MEINYFIISAIIICVLVIIYLAIKIIQSKRYNSSLTEEIKKCKKDAEESENKIIILDKNISLLSKYIPIIDVEAKINELKKESEAEIVRLRNDAFTEIERLKSEACDETSKLRDNTTKEVEFLLRQAKEELSAAKIIAADIKQKAEYKANELNMKSEAAIVNAQNKANEIVNEAQKRAVTIAGDAYTIKENADHFEKIAKAMKNIIDGYGDQYIIPTYSILDDLAEEFGFTEAGDKLKKARENSRLMVKSGVAAKCEYVEKNRKETAIEFVLDAFNGKVDTILSRVKKDNYGILNQMILDSYELVNNNGRAFRNAVITKEYFDSRLDELKWAVIVQELKWNEQEEQRRIKEQIREEERARKEYEKAIKEAQKNEETLKKLIEKAQSEVENANAEQKKKYEEKLAALENKLREAEEKNQRALSMAQQTKAGNVYVISNVGSFGNDVYKIGLTRRLEPLDRIRELGDASVPFEFDVHAMIFSEDAPTLEKDLHKVFMRMQVNKVNSRKEFFKVTLQDIRKEIEKMNIITKWTMTASAREYRESIAIENNILTDEIKLKEWERFQNETKKQQSEPIESIV